MTRKPYSQAVGLPSRHWLYRATLALMVAFGLTLMVMSKTGNPAVVRIRTSIADQLAPVLSVAARPLDAVSEAGQWFQEMGQLRADNIDLKNQNLRLREWQNAARDLEVENKSLRSLLNVIPPPKSTYITAHVVSDLGGPFLRSALISGGSDQGIKKDQAVINQDGLVGRIVEVGTSSARVLLITDINSRIPVVAEKSHEKSILIGNNYELPSLSYLSADSRVQVGERIVTSGDGGIFPKGITVGVVSSVEGGKVVVQPFVDSAKIDYINIVNFSL
jgi:rod shape-determining protein MreC